MLVPPSRSLGVTRLSCVTAPLSTVNGKGKPTVLLVDDDFSVCKSVCRVLSAEALQVVTANGVKDALNHIFRNTPNLVLTDLCMAPLTGWDFIFHLKNNYPTLPIFVVTALSRRAAGGVDGIATAFFQKPLDFDALLAAIRLQLVQQGFSLSPSLAQP